MLVRLRAPQPRGDRHRAVLAPDQLPARLAAPAAPARFLLAPPAPRDPAEPPIEVVTGPRVGVSGEGGSVRFPWRFSVAGHRSVSAFRRGRNVPD